ncbi:hypothetical protein [Actibacterium ureilyticum]|uniref:hypothetical protein n=1 Tax=Actibacterium ureilyticum TaxID=1590614 RepID=UPI000BAA9C60|nr:hypothetical protein [Actibacterium ureilyticum]
MNGDYYLVAGIIAGVLAAPALLGAFAESRPPRAAAVLVLICGGLITLALMNNPKGYAMNDVPKAFVRVFGELVQ